MRRGRSYMLYTQDVNWGQRELHAVQLWRGGVFPQREGWLMFLEPCCQHGFWAASAWPENLIKMQNVRPHPVCCRTLLQKACSKSYFNKVPRRFIWARRPEKHDRPLRAPPPRASPACERAWAVSARADGERGASAGVPRGRPEPGHEGACGVFSGIWILSWRWWEAN